MADSGQFLQNGLDDWEYGIDFGENGKFLEVDDLLRLIERLFCRKNKHVQ
jgi:hypothetical protein